MCRSYSSHVQVKFQSCAGQILFMCIVQCSVVKFQSCKLYNVQVIFQSCASQILVMCRSDSSHQSCAGQILVMCIVHCAVWSNSSHVHCTTCRSYSSHVKVKFQSCAGQILVQCALREGHFHFNLHVSFYAVVVEKPKMKIISFQNYIVWNSIIGFMFDQTKFLRVRLGIDI